MFVAITPDIIDSCRNLSNGENRVIILRLEYKNTPDVICDEITRFVTDNEFNQYNSANLDRMIKHYPHVVAGLVWQSAFYYSVENAAEVALAFLRNDFTAFEWNFHISSLGKMNLKQANDDVVIRSFDNINYCNNENNPNESYKIALQHVIETDILN